MSRISVKAILAFLVRFHNESESILGMLKKDN